jgi:excisionase family DNA binding protein
MSKSSAPPRRLLDLTAVADRLGVCIKTTRRMIDRHELPVHRIGRLIRVSEDDLEAFIASKRDTGIRKYE